MLIATITKDPMALFELILLCLTFCQMLKLSFPSLSSTNKNFGRVSQVEKIKSLFDVGRLISMRELRR
ncbi:MAG: hypothetical protein IT292_06025 [Deltaproteobacteria bacterium]|nr:hypothetical protein [Deltaproteobacteria bacterium]